MGPGIWPPNGGRKIYTFLTQFVAGTGVFSHPSRCTLAFWRRVSSGSRSPALYRPCTTLHRRACACHSLEGCPTPSANCWALCPLPPKTASKELHKRAPSPSLCSASASTQTKTFHAGTLSLLTMHSHQACLRASAINLSPSLSEILFPAASALLSRAPLRAGFAATL